MITYDKKEGVSPLFLFAVSPITINPKTKEGANTLFCLLLYLSVG